MVLQSSGQISIYDIHGEFGGNRKLKSYYGAASGIPTSGEISIKDFYGAGSVQTLYLVNSKFSFADMKPVLVNAGYDGKSAKLDVLMFGVFSLGQMDFTNFQTSYPGVKLKIDLRSGSFIAGKGGNGGTTGAGGAGGHAMRFNTGVGVEIVVASDCGVAGGGGGGGGAAFNAGGGGGAGGGNGGGGSSQSGASSTGGAGATTKGARGGDGGGSGNLVGTAGRGGLFGGGGGRWWSGGKTVGASFGGGGGGCATSGSETDAEAGSNYNGGGGFSKLGRLRFQNFGGGGGGWGASGSGGGDPNLSASYGAGLGGRAALFSRSRSSASWTVNGTVAGLR